MDLKQFIDNLKKEIAGIYKHIDKVIDLARPYNLFSDDKIDETSDALFKNFNYLTLNNGESYFIDKNINALKYFIKMVEISDNDDVWLQYVELKNGRCRQLRDII